MTPTVHRHNILIDENNRAKLGDFGFCREIPQLIGGRSVVTAALVSRSAGYAAPESDAGHISPKSDMFSYGVVRIIAVLFRYCDLSFYSVV